MTVIATGFDHARRARPRSAREETRRRAERRDRGAAHRRSPALVARDLRRRHRHPAVPALDRGRAWRRCPRRRWASSIAMPARELACASVTCRRRRWPAPHAAVRPPRRRRRRSSCRSPAGRCRSSTRAIREEHLAVRERARHLRRLAHGRDRDRGPQALELLQRLLSNDVAKIAGRRRAVQRAVPRGRRRARRPLHLPARRRPLPDGHERRQPRAATSPGSSAHADGLRRRGRATALDDYAMLAVQGPLRARDRAGGRRRAAARRA